MKLTDGSVESHADISQTLRGQSRFVNRSLTPVEGAPPDDAHSVYAYVLRGYARLGLGGERGRHALGRHRILAQP
jgi:hypothetical protein